MWTLQNSINQTSHKALLKVRLSWYMTNEPSSNSQEYHRALSSIPCLHFSLWMPIYLPNTQHSFQMCCPWSCILLISNWHSPADVLWKGSFHFLQWCTHLQGAHGPEKITPLMLIQASRLKSTDFLSLPTLLSPFPPLHTHIPKHNIHTLTQRVGGRVQEEGKGGTRERDRNREAGKRRLLSLFLFPVSDQKTRLP